MAESDQRPGAARCAPTPGTIPSLSLPSLPTSAGSAGSSPGWPRHLGHRAVDLNARSGVDAMTLEDWLRSRASSSTLDLMAIMARVTWGRASQVSMLHALHTSEAAGGWTGCWMSPAARATGPVRRGHPADRREDGRAAESCSGATVSAIDHDDTGVRVTSTAGTVAARAVIVAIPPQHRAGITFGPGLPARHQQLIKRWPQGALSKDLRRVRRHAFWRGR